MGLTRLEITNFRNLLTISLEPIAGLNIFYGENGSGKTSLLEAIYFLGLGRSFRHHLINRVINHEADRLSVFSMLCSENNILTPVGLEKDRDGKTRIRVDGENIQSAVSLAKLLPIQLINPDSYYLLEVGSKHRRQFLDWGVFHVEHSFFPAWKRVQRILKQRNAALKTRVKLSEIQLWDLELVEASTTLETLRKDYIDKLKPLFKQILSDLMQLSGVDLEYRCGWDTQRDLRDILRESISRDQQLGYTQFGPQRTDIKIYVNQHLAQDVLSRGQQKLLICALRLAQGLLLRQLTQQQCIYLIDDLAAELDAKHRRRIAEILVSLKSQIFVTAIEPGDINELLNMTETRMFQIDQGIVRYMV